MTIEEIQQIIKDKVSGVWVADHDDNGHRYRNTVTHKYQRSVTTKLGGVLAKPHLTAWAVKMAAEYLKEGNRLNQFQTERFYPDILKGMQLAHTDIRDDAGHVGTIAHNAAERYINDWIASCQRPADIRAFAPADADPRAIASMRAVESYFQKEDILPIASELLVGDGRYSAGTLDLLAMVAGKLTLVDFKTSNAVDQIGYSAQVAAYKHFFESMTGLKIEDCVILHLSKDYDKFTPYKVLNEKRAWSAFKRVCGTYDWMYDRKKEKISKDIKRISI